jgi:Ser/Thr protein kinase RdoA (MazF antagonist)
LTARLAERFPDHVPAPLAVEPEHGWILFPELHELFAFMGTSLDVRCEMLRRFAKLQRESALVTDELLEDGCLDRRLDVLERQVGQLLDDSAAVAKLTTDEAATLRKHKPALQEVCRRLARLDLPATLVHGDLHMLNVARHDGRLVYFDWTDACVAHPFIDLLSLQWEDEAGRAAMLSAYLEPWEGVESPERLLEAVGLASVVIPLHHAVSYWQIVAALEPAAKPELDATHTFLREALERLRELPGS